MKHDELIDKLRGCEDYRCDDCELRREEFCNPILMEKAADVIEELQSQLPKWIPAAERLPEEDSEVLIFTERRDVIYGTFADGMFSDDWQYYTPDYVVWWMYIPKPPKEEI